MSNFPKVGESVFLPATNTRKRTETHVAAVYLDGRVRVTSGDVYNVHSINNGKAWEAHK